MNHNMDSHGWEVELSETEGRNSLRNMIKGLTVRGSTFAADLADSWFGIGSVEENTLSGPSLLERTLGDEDQLAADLTPSLLLWDPSQLDLDFGIPPPVPSRTRRGPIRFSSSTTASTVIDPPSIDFEMDLMPPPLPPRGSYHPDVVRAYGTNAVCAACHSSKTY